MAQVIFSAFYSAEHWTPLDAFYFTVVSYSTIGFGDFSPDPHPSWFAAIFIVTTGAALGALPHRVHLPLGALLSPCTIDVWHLPLVALR